VLTSDDYHCCMGTRFKRPFFALVAIPIILVAHGAPRNAVAQSEGATTTESVTGRPSNGHDDWGRAPKILRAANSWRAGKPVPLELRRLRKSETDIPGPMDSRSLIARVRNLALLATLAADPSSDPECREDALSQGIEVGGPNRFFQLLRSQLSIVATTDIEPWVNEVRDRMSRPHAVVDALFISYEEMPHQEALAVVGRITDDLRRGVPWPRVYKRYSAAFRYDPPDPKTGDLTKIGLLGPLVIFPDEALGRGHMATVSFSSGKVAQWQGTPLPRHLWALAYFDPAHLPTLLNASVGDVISLPSELNHEYVLYQVREIYKGVGKPDISPSHD
jgi:hypothetical protein